MTCLTVRASSPGLKRIAACTSGLSQRIYTAWTGAGGNGFSPVLSADQANAVKALCYAIASSVVDEIQANATTSTPNATAGAVTLTGTVT